jgi:predicted acylesterase/phospholipase RssA
MRLDTCFSRAQPSPSILLLSGGGSHGAWGAGVLNGWSQAARPTFHIVTGISTGALQATFAFLGGEQYDAQLRQAYTTVRNRDVYRNRFVLTLPFANSLRTTKPLRRMIEQHLTDDVLAEVAQRFREEGRLLFVGTVDLDSGGFRVWDLTGLAMRGEYRLYRDIVWASASIPVVFQPIELHESLHVDGGVRQQVFTYILMKEIAAAYKRTRGEYRSDRPTVYVIVNGKLVPERRCVANHILDIGVRSLEILLTEGMLGSLFRAKHTLDVTGDQWRFLVSRIPEDYCLNFAADEFDPERMSELFNAGYEWGQTPQWFEGIPDPDVSPLPCDCGERSHLGETR